MRYELNNEGVRIKEEAQRKLEAEFEARRGEFSSFEEFVRVKAGESEFVRQIKEKITGIKRAA